MRTRLETIGTGFETIGAGLETMGNYFETIGTSFETTGTDLKPYEPVSHHWTWSVYKLVLRSLVGSYGFILG